MQFVITISPFSKCKILRLFIFKQIVRQLQNTVIFPVCLLFVKIEYFYFLENQYHRKKIWIWMKRVMIQRDVLDHRCLKIQ